LDRWLAFIASSVPSFQPYLVAGHQVIGPYGAHSASNWTLDAVNSVSKAIDQVAEPDEKVASFWPGYVKRANYGHVFERFGKEVLQARRFR
jgi:hypothetical protein